VALKISPDTACQLGNIIYHAIIVHIAKACLFYSASSRPQLSGGKINKYITAEQKSDLFLRSETLWSDGFLTPGESQLFCIRLKG
jgi:hypothetical protein